MCVIYIINYETYVTKYNCFYGNVEVKAKLNTLNNEHEIQIDVQ